jgi:hypothetical protein
VASGVGTGHGGYALTGSVGLQPTCTEPGGACPAEVTCRAYADADTECHRRARRFDPAGGTPDQGFGQQKFRSGPFAFMPRRTRSFNRCSFRAEQRP